MLLRTRVILIVCLVFVVLAGVLVTAGLKREELAAQGHAEATVVTQRTVWQMITLNLITSIERGSDALRTDSALRSALSSEDRSAIANAVRPYLGRIRAERIEILGLDGKLLYNSGGEPLWSSTLDVASVDEVVLHKSSVRGMELNSARRFVAMLSMPIQAGGADGEVFGVLTLTTGIEKALEEFRRSTGAEALLVNRRGRLIQGTVPQLWDTLGGENFFSRRNEIVTAEHMGQSLAVTTVPLEGPGKEIRAYLVIAKDVTDSFREQQRVSLISAISAVGVLALVMAGLFRYLSTSFGPLDDAITVLNALSRGDTSVAIEAARRNDEIGRIANTVDVFRRHMSQIDRLKRSREKQRRRQERFIKKEMNKLAVTLDDESRTELMRDLAHIESEAARQTKDGQTDELGVMAGAFRHLAERVTDQHTKLGQLIEELREALKAKTAFVALQQELDIAREIQMSMLPQEFPPRPDVEVYGGMTPAKEVGGDFYDFFLIDEFRMGVVVADVSGKGVPAAFFMAMSRTLLKATALFGEPPGVVMAKLNDLLSENNAKNLFVTVFYGVLDLRTGRFDFCNGGHPPPMLMHTDGTISLLEYTDGMALAIMEGMEYEERTIYLSKDEAIFFYTDGVTEAFNPADEEFGEQRIVATLADGWAKLPTAEIPSKMTEVVHTFADTAPQSDDITCVCLRYLGDPVVAQAA
jgi:sigma-B regulation protein RsbU (phosphoserine phosphatase)